MIPAAQFSVHRSPSRIAARPFVVIFQSDDFKRMPSRVVAPLVVPGAMPGLDGEHPRAAPILVVKGRVYILNPFDLAIAPICHREERGDAAIPIKARMVMGIATSLCFSR